MTNFCNDCPDEFICGIGKACAKRPAVDPLNPHGLTEGELDRIQFGLLTAVSETIRDLKEIPSGTLMTALQTMIKDYTLIMHKDILGALENAGLVRVENHLVKWVGPR